MQVNFQDFDSRSARAFAKRMKPAKNSILHIGACWCVAFLPAPILIGQELSRRSGNGDTKAHPTSVLRDYGLAKRAHKSVGGALRLAELANPTFSSPFLLYRFNPANLVPSQNANAEIFPFCI